MSELQQVGDYLGKRNNILAQIGGLFAAPAGILLAGISFAEQLKKANVDPKWAPYIALCVFIAIIIWLCAGYLKFRQSSRLEDASRFNLRATTRESLIGRDEDVDILVKMVSNNCIVFLDGESGCGKSALAAAGVKPRLEAEQKFLPVLVREWGEDWEKGPLAATLDDLFSALKMEERRKLSWTTPPNLTAPAAALAKELSARILAIFQVLGRRVLLIADQFDDYQLQHRKAFLTEDGIWRHAADLARANLFWHLVDTCLKARNSPLHLLVVTRKDASLGLKSLRFLDSEDKTLERVDSQELRGLLNRIAPDDEKPLVVAHPEFGWTELRVRVEEDLTSEGRLLMQQVRTVLLGLRELPTLTLGDYRKAGGLRGVEALYVSRALKRATEKAGGGNALTQTRALLNAMIDPGDARQQAKAKVVLLSKLEAIAGSKPAADAIVRALEQEELIRPSHVAGQEESWQVDHDYLARAIIAEGRQANPWGERLRDGKARFDEAVGFGPKMARLLPVGDFFRIGWERLRGRMAPFGAAAGYFRRSAVKPAGLVLLAALVCIGSAVWMHQWQVDRKAEDIITAMTTSEDAATQAAARDQIWRADASLHNAIFHALSQNNTFSEGKLAACARAKCLLAQTGFGQAELKKMAQLLRTQLSNETNPSRAYEFADGYATIAANLFDDTELEAGALALRPWLDKSSDILNKSSTGLDYSQVISGIHDDVFLKAEAEALEERLDDIDEKDGWTTGNDTIVAYQAVLAHIQDKAILKLKVRSLRAKIATSDSDSLDSLITFYTAAALNLADNDELEAGAAVLREKLADSPYAADSYTRILPQIEDQAALRAEARALHDKISRTPNLSALETCALYSSVAKNLHDQDELTAYASALLTIIKRKLDENADYYCDTAYATVVVNLTDAAAVKNGLIAIRSDDLGDGYEVIFANITNENVLKDELSIVLPLYEANANSPAANGYYNESLALLRHIKDQAVLSNAVSGLRLRYFGTNGRSGDDNYGWIYGVAIKNLTAQNQLTTDLAVLHKKLEASTIHSGNGALDGFADANYADVDNYALVAANVSDRNFMQSEAASLRRDLSDNRYTGALDSLVVAYAAAAVASNDHDELLTGASLLRGMLAKEAGGLEAAASYAQVAIQLGDEEELKAGMLALRQIIVGRDFTHLRLSDKAVEAYSDIVAARVRGVLSGAMKGDPRSLIVEVLTDAGNPAVDSPRPLISALTPLAKGNPNESLGDAAAWAQKVYGIDPESLRPAPIRKAVPPKAAKKA